MPSLPLNDLVRIAAAGGGFDIIADEYGIDELARIASAASKHKSRLRILQCGRLGVKELTRLGSAGKGGVWFEL